MRLLILTLVAPVAAAQISSTKHNLGPTGAFTIKAPAATDTCIFCHSPHDTFMSRPLWNHQPSSALYTPYSSSTSMRARPRALWNHTAVFVVS